MDVLCRRLYDNEKCIGLMLQRHQLVIMHFSGIRVTIKM